MEDTGGNMTSAWSAPFVENVLVMVRYVFHPVDQKETLVRFVDVALEIRVAQNAELVERAQEKKET